MNVEEVTTEGSLVKTIWTLSMGIFLFAYIMIVAPINNTVSSPISPRVEEIIKTNQKIQKVLNKKISKYVYIKKEKFKLDANIAL